MMHLAIHDALNTIDRRFRPYVLDMPGPSGASAEAAVATAAHDVLVSDLKQLVPVFYQIPDYPGMHQCQRWQSCHRLCRGARRHPGRCPKDAGYGDRACGGGRHPGPGVADGADTLILDFGYPQGTEPGAYRFTPEAPFAFLPGWGKVTPFGLHDSAQFRPGPPYAVTSPKYTADFNEVKSLGARDSSTRTADQTQIARFWLESSPLQWNRIARTASATVGLDMWENARLFALLNVALADGYIGSWETKYHYNYWRPETAIQTAATDGNPDTVLDEDEDWIPLEPTPGIPDYDSGHSVQGGAGSTGAEAVLRDGQVQFQHLQHDPTGRQ